MAAMTWFRMYGDLASNRKVQRLSEADQRRYVMLMCLQCQGKYAGATVEDLAFDLRITTDEMESTLARLKAARLVEADGSLHDWDDRQYTSDTSAARTRNWRKRKSAEGGRHSDADVTSHGRHRDGSETPSESESDSESETEGDLPKTEEEAPGRAAPGADPESPPDVADAPPEARRDQLASPKQQRFAARLLAPHGLTVASWLEAAGYDELLDSDVDQIRERYGGRPEPPTRGPRAHELPQAEDPDMSAEERAASAAALAMVKTTGQRKRSTGNTAGATN